MNERAKAKLPNFSDAAERREPLYQRTPAVTRERCIMAAGDGLERAKMAMQQWSTRASSPAERRTVEVLARRVDELIQAVGEYTRTL